jgi:hypothetical protein
MRTVFLSVQRHLVCVHFLFALFVGSADAQISPGELSSAHAQLDGITNCTQCHSLGKTISSDRCLSCHVEIHSSLDRGTGLHGRNKYRLCIDCHKEHHGKAFPLRKIDTKIFDHSLTGYILAGKHASLGCQQCHNRENIQDSVIVRKGKEFLSHTYSGLLSSCLSCHKDIHRGQLSQQCDRCHTPRSWSPATGFSHDRVAFTLTGKHKTVACAECHKKTYDAGRVVQYTHLEYAACAPCHTDPHRGKFKKACQDCHSTMGWDQGAAKSFDHSLTRFPLQGKHVGVKCSQCHMPAAKKMKNGTGAFAIARFQQCADCHADSHGGQFAHRPDNGRCESCHTEKGFLPSTYTVSDHTNTRFVLTGAHIATACTACHLAGAVHAKSSRLFQWKEDLQCAVCHKDAHSGEFTTSSKKSCEMCHTTNAWNNLLFTHESTHFSLKGKHAQILCEQCHSKAEIGFPAGRKQYRSLSQQCFNCHKDEHEGQFSLTGVTDSARCHSTISWKIENFNHTTMTRFVLTGKHVSVPCGKCHKPTTSAGRLFTRYKPLRADCVDCHPSGKSNENK